MSDDISHILKSWKGKSGQEITVRLIGGDDGTPKIQMRIDMGVIQMELDGNPSGENPEGYDSWLQYCESKRKEYEAGHVDDFYSLSVEDFRKLRHEGVQYYYRYLSLMELDDFVRVVRDTDRNLRLFAFVKKYAASEMDRWSLDQFRPYVIMMNTRAKASLLLKEDPKKGIEQSIEMFDYGIGRIINFYNEYGLEEEIENSVEMSILKALKTEFVSSAPDTLQEKLQKAITEERFEDAANIRDELKENQKNE
ncbi:UvrB/UvrC motif-containing protein [Candidatus Latescibacterota bacterium]